MTTLLGTCPPIPHLATGATTTAEFCLSFQIPVVVIAVGRCTSGGQAPAAARISRQAVAGLVHGLCSCPSLASLTVSGPDALRASPVHSTAGWLRAPTPCIRTRITEKRGFAGRPLLHRTPSCSTSVIRGPMVRRAAGNGGCPLCGGQKLRAGVQVLHEGQHAFSKRPVVCLRIKKSFGPRGATQRCEHV